MSRTSFSSLAFLSSKAFLDAAVAAASFFDAAISDLSLFPSEAIKASNRIENMQIRIDWDRARDGLVKNNNTARSLWEECIEKEGENKATTLSYLRSSSLEEYVDK